MNPKVTIIILNWNGLKDTIECLNSLKKINYPNYEVVVVDNGSSNNEAYKIENKFNGFVNVIKNNKNDGFAEGNNIAIKKIFKNNESKYVLLLNNDTTVNEDFLNKLVNTADINPKIGITSPKILYYYSKNVWFKGGKINWWLGKPYHANTNKGDYTDFISGCCMLINSKALNKLDYLFDEKYFCYFEDADLCERIKKAGYLLKVSQNSTIWHKVSATAVVESKFSVYHKARNRIIFMKKNCPKWYYLYFFYFYQIFIKTILSLFYFPIKQKSFYLVGKYIKGLKDGLNYSTE